MTEIREFRGIRRAVVFAHYDQDDLLDDYVKYLLRHLGNYSQALIFVSTSNLAVADIAYLENIAVKVILRENVGYDFFSYKVGIASIDVRNFDEVVLCNDSVYGPLLSLDILFSNMPPSKYDFWGVTESYEFSRHLQSYFMVFGLSVLRSGIFEEFWQEVCVLESKAQIIREYEVGLSTRLIDAGFRIGAFVSSDNVSKSRRISLSWRQYVNTLRRRWRERLFWSDVFHVIFLGRQIALNPTHMEWRSLILDFSVPFLKIELLRDNPKAVDSLSQVNDVITENGDYPVDIIDRHLRRMLPDKSDILR